MTGQKLYEQWGTEMYGLGVEVDEWDELSSTMQMGWEKLAVWIRDRASV